MPTDIKLKNSVTATNTPTSLQQGEVAINITDKKVWVGNAATTPVQLLGAGASGTFGALTVTSLSDSGNLTFTGTGNRILGDFSNATVASRVAFQTSTTNSNTNIGVLPNGTATGGGCLVFNNSDPTNSAFGQLLANGATDVRVTSGILGTGTYLPLTMYTGGSERLRIDTSGNCGIGTSSPTAKLNVSGIVHVTGAGSFPSTGTGIEIVSSTAGGTNYVQAYNRTGATWQNLEISSAQTVFGTGGSERMRITSGGELFVGLSSSGSSGAIGQFYKPSDGNCLSARVSNNSFAPFAGYNAADSVIFYVNASGSIFAVNTAITAISDARHKENIRDLDTGLQQILNLRPRRFDWREGRGDGKKDVVGFIAQEVETVLPDVVGEWKEDLNKEESWKALATGNMIPTLVKAIQEQQAMITELKATVDAQAARIAALESN
jgi:hypothetical protein